MRALRRASIAVLVLLVSACGHADDRTVPAGMLLPRGAPGAAVGGVYPSTVPNDANCCWAKRDVSFRVRKTGEASDFALKVYVPDVRTFRATPQGFTATIDRRVRIDRCCFRPGLHTVLFPLPPDVRSKRGIVDVALRMRQTIVPSKEGLGKDDRTVSVVVVGAGFSSFMQPVP